MSLRLVTCNVMPHAYAVIARWAERHGHDIVLLVTSPAGTAERYGVSYLEAVAAAAPQHAVLVTENLRAATPLIAATQPDLLLSASFPHRIPTNLTAIPRYGAYNLHPAALPQGRGPNPLRLIYEGSSTTGVTLHQISPRLDAGDIFSRREAPLPEELTAEGILSLWDQLCDEVLDEGIARALAGEPGTPQDEAQASYAAPFTPEEHWLRWDRPLRLLRNQAAALMDSAYAELDGKPVTILSLDPDPTVAPDVLPGTVLHQSDHDARVRVLDGVAHVTYAPYPNGDNVL
ncbi:MAG: hypothetical protein KC442_23505 [Thermomicrobiales bacterium]|nr:hypothetical protein [Thermomicrobiales bacterium]